MMRGVGLSDPPQPEGDTPPGPASGGPPGHLCSPRDCLGSLTPQHWQLNLISDHPVSGVLPLAPRLRANARSRGPRRPGYWRAYQSKTRIGKNTFRTTTATPSSSATSSSRGLPAFDRGTSWSASSP